MSLAPELYRGCDATALAGLIRQGEITADAARVAALAAIARLDPKLGVIACLAAEPDGRTGILHDTDAPFAGVPFLLKDLHAPAWDLPLTNGSRHFAGLPASADSNYVARLRRAGLTFVGRSTSSEFGINLSTEPHAYRPVRNPWAPGRSAGGSSGGAAAAVAAGIVPVAHVTDSVGSIRIPAACRGVVGLKPTRGRNPLGPHRGDGTQGLSVEHVVTRSVRDCAALLDATAGPDPGAPHFAALPPRPFASELDRDPAPWRIGVLTRTFAGEPVDPGCRDAALGAAGLLASLGHDVEEAAPDVDVAALETGVFTILMAGIAGMLAGLAAQTGRVPSPDTLEPLSLAVDERGRSLSAVDFLGGLGAVNREVRRLAQLFERYDAPAAAGRTSHRGRRPRRRPIAHAAFLAFHAALQRHGPARDQPAARSPPRRDARRRADRGAVRRRRRAAPARRPDRARTAVAAPGAPPLI
jgi:amidase